MSQNPFDKINARLTAIENELKELRNEVRPMSRPSEVVFIAISKICDTYFSKPTFYEHVKTGKIKLYKFGARSFVKASEFYGEFVPITVK